MEQFVHTATRKDNILDLVFTNSDEVINGCSTIINRQFSDHNTLRISLNYQYRNEVKLQRKNPYPNSIYEYDLMKATDENWVRYDILLSKLSEDFDIKIQNEDTQARLMRFYNVIEEAVKTLFEKKDAFKPEEEKERSKGNKIPKNMRLLSRKKTMISKKILKSSSGVKTLKLMLNLENIEKELEISYKSMKIKKEKEALHKIKRNPKYFYKYAKQFSKTRSRVGPLLNKNGETVPFHMGEILRKQYESTFSPPHNEGDKEALDVEGGDKTITEEVDETSKEEGEGMNTEEEEITEDKEEQLDKEGQKLNEEDKNKNSDEEEDGPPKLYDVPFDYMDIVDAINQLSECSGPGPDGISAILLKISKITIALMLWNIFQHSLEKGDIPAILKMGFICPILKPGNQ